MSIEHEPQFAELKQHCLALGVSVQQWQVIECQYTVLRQLGIGPRTAFQNASNMATEFCAPVFCKSQAE